MGAGKWCTSLSQMWRTTTSSMVWASWLGIRSKWQSLWVSHMFQKPLSRCHTVTAWAKDSMRTNLSVTSLSTVLVGGEWTAEGRMGMETEAGMQSPPPGRQWVSVAFLPEDKTWGLLCSPQGQAGTHTEQWDGTVPRAPGRCASLAGIDPATSFLSRERCRCILKGGCPPWLPGQLSRAPGVTLMAPWSSFPSQALLSASGLQAPPPLVGG